MSIRQLVGETAVYGLSSILGRFVNFLLVPLYTWLLVDREFGDIAFFYAGMGFLKVIFTLQLDTAFFRFGADPAQRDDAYRSILRPAVIYIALLGVLMFVAAPVLATWTGYAGYTADFRLVAILLALDAFSEFPLARLRLEQRPARFAAIRLTGIAINIAANVLLLWILPSFFTREESPWLYPSSRLTLVLWANLAASAVVFLWVSPHLAPWKRPGSMPWKPVLRYAAPLVVVSLAGVVNEMLDRQLLRYLLPGDDEHVRAQIGIYSATYRLAMVIALFTQAFRYAAEPFFFRQALRQDAPGTYARVTRYYTLAASAGLLVVLLFQDVIKYFIGREGSTYHEGLPILPILLLANVFLGLYYNFSVWYKVSDRTRAGAWIALAGAATTILLNTLLIPAWGYVASAWATLICYALMCLLSLYWGHRLYPVPYPFLVMGLYLGSAGLLAWGHGVVTNSWELAPRLILASVLALAYAGFWGWREYRTAKWSAPV